MSYTPPPPQLTRNLSGDPRIIGPVWQFALLMVPLVMNGFFLIYALAGWVIEGRDKRNWSLEAPSVSVSVCLGMVCFCLLIIAFIRWRGARWGHPLMISCLVHIGLALGLAASVFLSVTRV